MTSAKYIGLADVYRILRRGEPCDIVVCSYDKTRKTGGERNEYFGVVLAESLHEKTAKNGRISKSEDDYSSRNPHHNQHITVLIQLQNRSVEKIRPHLIEKINGVDVAL